VKVLLDNCLDWRVKNLLTSHQVSHCKDLGWGNLSNGLLLAAAAGAGFAVMITGDKKIKYEQNLDQLPLPVIEIDTRDSRLPAIAAISQQLNQALTLVGQSRFISIGPDGRITTIPS
jgi:predicted nuclease of predicted toxin-antitoxin system